MDGSGNWLMPSLIDMHVHFTLDSAAGTRYGPEEILAPFVAHGVLEVVNMAADEAANALRDEIHKGRLRAPRIATAHMVDGDPPIRGTEVATVLRTSEDARRAVQTIKSAGYDFIKVYSRLEIDVFRELLEAARAEDIRVIGHIPGRGNVEASEALLPGFALVAHAEEFAFRAPQKSDDEIAAFVEIARANGIALTSTLFLDEQLTAQTRDPSFLANVEGLEHVNPAELPSWFEENRYTSAASPDRIARLEAMVKFNRRLVMAFVEAGIPVLAGTDAGIPGVVAGYSLHHELQALERAGLTNTQILQAATIKPAKWLGIADDRGTIEIGKRANLILLSASPLEEISNTTKIVAVVIDGRIINREELNGVLSQLSSHYAPVRQIFSQRASGILSND
jgi:imidazolonepropionase-like amidohydrolase